MESGKFFEAEIILRDIRDIVQKIGEQHNFDFVVFVLLLTYFYTMASIFYNKILIVYSCKTLLPGAVEYSNIYDYPILQNFGSLLLQKITSKRSGVQ